MLVLLNYMRLRLGDFPENDMSMTPGLEEESMFDQWSSVMFSATFGMLTLGHSVDYDPSSCDFKFISCTLEAMVVLVYAIA